MKILFDDQVFTNQKYGGISRYFVNLYEKINQYTEHSADISVKRSDNEHLQSLEPHKRNLFTTKKSLLLQDIGKRFSGSLNRRFSIKYIEKGQYDVFHPTYFSPYVLDHIKKPFVLTVYDMIHEHFPKHFPNNSTSAHKKQLCEHAAHIIAISHSTKKDLIELFGIPEGKVSVVHLAGALNPSSTDIESPDLPEKYILFVGNRDFYKNFKCLYLAMRPMLQKDKDLHLVCTGPEFNDAEVERFSKDGIQDQITHKFVDDSTMYSFYNNAIAFVFPSLYEGFGIPVLESFSAQCPAILCSTSSLSEIGGNAALYFNGNDHEELRESIIKVISDNAFREKLVADGLKRLNDFSWSKTASETLAVYEKCI